MINLTTVYLARHWLAPVAAALLFAFGNASAHTSLRSSEPAADAVLEHGPQQVSLQFSEAVRLTALSVRTADGQTVPLSAGQSGAHERFAAELPALPAGENVIAWRVISADTHVVSGEIRFTVLDRASH